jgi:YD repeat-containing protein
MRPLRVVRALRDTGLVLVLAAASAFAADPLFDNKGFSPNREFARGLPFEHIDPLTGNLLLTFTDIHLPGNAGFDLNIQRVYNIKIYDAYSNTAAPHVGENDPAGLGWTVGFGKVSNLLTAPLNRPVIEMPDGSKHPTFKHMAGGDEYITRQMWTLDRHGARCHADGPDTCPVLRLPNGVTYFFNHGTDTVSGPLWATRISDTYGNRMEIEYEPYEPSGPAYIREVRLCDASGGCRTVTFTYDDAPVPGGAPVRPLRKVEFGSQVWRYNYTGVTSGTTRVTLLASVEPPEGPSWIFDYIPDGPHERAPFLLERLTTPQGGTVDYSYRPHLFRHGSSVLYTPVIHTRRTGGNDIPTGNWTYTFNVHDSWADPVVVTVAEPCRTTVYETFTIGPAGDERPDQIGALKKKTISGPGVNQTEIHTWQASDPLSPDADGLNPIRAPLPSRVTITRDGGTHTTTHTYHSSPYDTSNPRSFNDYGNPEVTTESGPGPLVRTTRREYFLPVGTDLSLGPYVAGKVSAEHVRVGNSPEFSRTFVHDTLARRVGFLKSQTIYGLTTTFTPDGHGNVEEAVDGEGHSTSYEYRYGVASSIKTADYEIRREIHPDGTMKSERRRGNFTTFFTYDHLTRLRRIEHPANSADTLITYSADERSITRSRGPSSISTTLDGFGRPTATTNSLHDVNTDTDYDACGRTSYQSYPFSGANIGTHFFYDALDRVTRKTNPDDTGVGFGYSAGAGGMVVTIEDEEHRVTRQEWHAFGHPEDSRLVSVTDGENQVTSYAYHPLGGLSRVDSPEGGDREWTYLPGTDRVSTETHPENGTTTFHYLEDGLVETRSDPEFGTTTFAYDGSHRVTEIFRPESSSDVSIRYDDSDNRTLLERGHGLGLVSSKLGPYDGNNRLEAREDDIGGQKLLTRYTYDSRDNVDTITYPSGAQVSYDYDSDNRVTAVRAGPEPGALKYAHSFAHHPSGGVASYTAGNGTVHTVGYDPSRYWIKSAISRRGAELRTSVLYDDHDDVGNVTELNDWRLGSFRLTYDNVDRLRTMIPNPTSSFRNEFHYDTIGNRTRKTITPGGLAPQITNYQYHAANNRLEHATGAEAADFGYDDNGNTTLVRHGGAEDVYTYDADNMLATAEVGGTTTAYAYDGDMLRKRKQTAGQTTLYAHGPGNQLLGEYRPYRRGGAPVREYVYAGARIIASVKPAWLTVAPETLAFAVLVGTPPSAAQNVAIEAGTATVGWQARTTHSWIRLSPGSGTTPGTLAVQVDPADLEVGLYTGTVTVTAPDALGSPAQVTVLMAVVNEAGLVVLPRPLRYAATEGDTGTLRQTMHVLHAGGPPVQWDAVVSPSAPWISLAGSSGDTPSTVVVAVDPTGRRRGTHRGTITVTAPGAEGSPKLVPVELLVQPGPGNLCHPESWYCERFDDMQAGPVDGQRGWSATGGSASADPRGAGKVLLIDPPSVGTGTINGVVEVAEHPIDGNQVTAQIMVADVPPEHRQVGKLEFQTLPGVAWGKSGRTYGALRFGSRLYLQFGPNVWKVLVEQLENGRWYEVRVVYDGGRIYAYVDGVQRFTGDNPLAGTHPTQAFAFTGWDLPGQGHVDLLEARAAESGLVVEPQPLRFSYDATVELPTLGAGAPVPAAAAATDGAKPVARGLAHLAGGFEANRGQAPGGVKFLRRGRPYAVSLDEGGIAVAPSATADPVRIRFEDARAATMEGLEPLPGRVHYLRGRGQSFTDVARFGRVRYAGLYPGVDLEVYSRERLVEYDLVVAPGADPTAVRLSFEGARSLLLDADGDLVLETAWGTVRHRRPVVYQESGGVRAPVAGGYVVTGPRQASFELGEYDRSLPLVVDPVLVLSTYLGGPSDDQAEDVAVDSDGAVYITGNTTSPVFVAAEPVRIGTLPGPEDPADVFVAKINPSGTAIEWLTYISGTSLDIPAAVAVDQAGRATVVGRTHSLDFPTAPPNEVFQPTSGGGEDAFVLRLNTDGSALEYSTYLGGVETDQARDVALDPEGGAVVVGDTWSANFPTLFPLPGQRFFQGPAGSTDGFLSWFHVSGRGVLHSTFLGGDNIDNVFAVLVNEEGKRETPRTMAYVTGFTESSNFPTTPGVVQRQRHGWSDGFVTRVARSEIGLGLPRLFYSYSTLVGGPFQEYDGVGGIAVDSNRTAHIVFGQQGDGTQKIRGLADGGGQYLFERPMNGASDLAFDHEGNLHVIGHHSQPCWTWCPTWVLPFFVRQVEGDAAYVAKLDPGGTIRFATDLGCDVEGRGTFGTGLAVFDGKTYVTGTTSCEDYPTVEALQPNHADGFNDAFLTVISDADLDVDVVEFTAAQFRTSEAGDTVTGDDLPAAVITLRRTGSLAEQSTVTFRTADGSARAGQDYVATTVTVTFPPGEDEATVLVPLLDDVLPEQTETVALSLTDPVSARLGTNATATLLVDDDDGLVRTLRIHDRILTTGPQWTIEESVPWLNFSATSGIGPSAVTATADPGDRPAGTYTEYFVVTGNTGDSPQIVEAILRVLP